ncbi:two-component system sensor histidine kinase YesM [Paenibacillus sp. V4I3]|uniref:sensor histidine kinase n=1 Tax=Paenibacillus sp. V4I3 TaxID=3042305 RepID=UPI002788FAEF|nr:histidine kinase [Paenibacillus sp. V4I3]MDQ0877877.1 two-component system sensor histidine kinase YesM [Paenibacillus sp. V4I3]
MKLQVARKTSKWFVYQKMIIVFILFFLPLISMNIWLNYKGMSLTRQTILNSAVAGADFYSKQLDNELYLIRKLQLQLLNDDNLQKLSFRGRTLEDYEKVELINRVIDRLATLTESSEYVVNAGVYVEAIGKTISTTNDVTVTPNPEMELIKSLIPITPKPSFYQIGERIFFIEVENYGGIWSYIEISIPKLLNALREITNLYPESNVFLGNQESGVVLTTAKEVKDSVEILNLTSEPSVKDSNGSVIRKLNGISYFIIRDEVSSMHLSLMMYVNQNEITRPLVHFSSWFYSLFFMAVIVMVLYSFSVHLMIHRPISKLVKAFHMIEADSLNIIIESKSNDEFHYVFNGFNNMAHKLKKSIEEIYEQKIALQHSQFKQLQSQINPHFLYNCFFNIHVMCQVGDTDGAATLSQKLGSYYQYITRSGSDEVPFYKEYRHALDYCEIQCIRFSNRIAYEYQEISNIPQFIPVPWLIIQPIVENVFEHAFEDGTEEGIVYISTDYHEGRLQVTVEDNGNMLTDEHVEQLRKKLAMDSKHIEKTGLINVNNRLQLKYASGSGLIVSRSPYGGLKVDLVIIFG